MPNHELDSIQANNRGDPYMVQNCLSCVFDWWLKNEQNVTPEKLAQAVHIVGEHKVEVEIKKKFRNYMHHSFILLSIINLNILILLVYRFFMQSLLRCWLWSPLCWIWSTRMCTKVLPWHEEEVCSAIGTPRIRLATHSGGTVHQISFDKARANYTWLYVWYSYWATEGLCAWKLW